MCMTKLKLLPFLLYVIYSILSIVSMPSTFYMYAGASSYMYLFLFAVELSSKLFAYIALVWSVCELLWMIVASFSAIRQNPIPFLALMGIDLLLVTGIIITDVVRQNYVQLPERLIGLGLHLAFFIISIRVVNCRILTETR